MFTAINATLTATSNAIVTFCRTMEKSIGLLETEVDSLGEEQAIRMDELIADRQQRRKQREETEGENSATAQEQTT